MSLTCLMMISAVEGGGGGAGVYIQCNLSNPDTHRTEETRFFGGGWGIRPPPPPKVALPPPGMGDDQFNTGQSRYKASPLNFKKY